MSIDSHMICRSRNRGRDGTGCGLLVHAAHHIAHCTGDVLTNNATNSHTCHHGCGIETGISTAQVNTASTVGAHLTERVCTGDTHLGLLFHLIGTKVGGARVHTLSILAFLSLDTQCLGIVFGFDSLFFGDIPNLGFCLCLCGCTGEFSGYAHELPIALAGLVDFDGTDIHAGYSYAKCFLQPLGNIKFDGIVNLGCLAFNLNDRDIVCSGSVRYSILYIPIHGIPNLLLEIVKVEVAQSVEFYKFPVISDSKTDRSSDSNRHAKIHNARIVNIKEGNPKSNLNDSGEVTLKS